MLYSERYGGADYAKISCNAAVSDSVSAGSAVSEADILDLYRTALHGGMDIRTCQWESAGAVDPRHDLGVGAAGDCDAGDRISRKFLRYSDACAEAGHAHRSDGIIFVGESILKNGQRWINLNLPLFSIEIFIKIWYNVFIEMGCEYERR